MRQHPERDGLLVCLVCDAAREQLGRHVRMEHGLTPEQYRAAYGLPEWTALSAWQVACQLCGRPCRDAGRHAQRTHGLTADQYRDQVGLTVETSLLAPAVRVAEQARIAAMTAANRQRAGQTRRDLDALAQRHGYTGLQDLLERTATLPAKEVSALVGRDTKGGWVTHWRTELGVRSRSRTVRAERREQQQTAAVAGWPDGVQPTRDDGSLLCRVCGLWYHELPKHLPRHGLSVQQYRDRFGLPATVLLVNPGTWATRDTDPWRRRYQQRAQAAGHADVAALLAASDDDHAARLLGVQTRTIRAMRSRRSADANGQA